MHFEKRLGAHILLERLENRTLMSAAIPAANYSQSEVLVQLKVEDGIGALKRWVRLNPGLRAAKAIDIAHSKVLIAENGKSLLQVALKSHQKKPLDAQKVVTALSKWKKASFAQPNFIYKNTKSDFSPNDPGFNTQNYLAQIQASAAWNVTTGSSNVVVAVLDDGIWATHEDFAGVIWTNPGEIDGDGIDNDNNGFIDDINGWNFGENSNNIVESFNPNFNFTDTHGSIVSGMIGAVTNNGKGIAGVAGGGVKIMPVKFNGYGINVTSAMLANSLIYATNNGAKIINVSYAIDYLANDNTFNAAMDYAYSHDVLYFGSAGNTNELNAARLSLQKGLFIGNVSSNDAKYSTSNYGAGVDLSAPGVTVYSTYAGGASNNSYGYGTGTSFSSAIASGVAALIWSAHPTWTRDQVAAQIIGTTDSIDAKNPAYAGLLGSGRVNAFRAVGDQVGAPKIRSVLGIPAEGSNAVVSPTSITLDLRNVFDPATLISSAFELRGAGEDGSFDTGDDILVPLTMQKPYSIGTNRVTLGFDTLADGQYRFTAGTTLTDPFGVALDGNGDGVAGDALTRTFKVGVAPGAPIAPANLSAVSNSGTTMTLAWDDNSTDETGFVLERALDANFLYNPVTLAVEADTTGYLDTGLVTGLKYFYRLRAVNASGDSANSNIAQNTTSTGSPNTIPVIPSNVVAEATTFSTSKLTWTDNADNETSFTIQRSTTADFSGTVQSYTAGIDTVSFGDSGLTSLTNYYYRVRASNQAGSSEWSNVAAFKTFGSSTDPAQTPTTLTTTAFSTTQVIVRWTAFGRNETSFEVQRASDAGFTNVLKTLVAPQGGSSYYDWGLSPATTYYYRVRALNSIGNSDWSAGVEGATAGFGSTAPAAPSDVTITPIGTTQLKILWKDNSDNEANFVFDRATDAAFTENLKTTIAAGDSTQYWDWGLSPGTTYYYRIRAVNPSGASDNSPTVIATTDGGDQSTPPTAPSALTAVGNSSTEIKLQWTVNSNNEAHFEFQRASDAGFTNILASRTANAGASQYWDWGLTAGPTYYYRIRAVNAAGPSAWSDTISSTTLLPDESTPPAAPLAPSATTVSSSEIAVHWSDNSHNETAFVIERSRTNDFAVIEKTLTGAAESTGYWDWGLEAGTTYYYRVRATNAAGPSANTETVTATTAP